MKNNIIETIKIVLAGEGGQGVQIVGEILAEAAYISGLESLYIPNFGVEQRGGVSVAFIQISSEKIGAPKFKKADLLVVLSPRSVARTSEFIKEQTIYVYDNSQIKAPQLDDRTIGIQGYDTIAPEEFSSMVGKETGPAINPPPFNILKPFGIPAATIAKEELSPRVFNIIILGVVVSLLKVLETDKVTEAIRLKLGAKFKTRPDLEELNFRALQRGFQLAEAFASNQNEVKI